MTDRRIERTPMLALIVALATGCTLLLGGESGIEQCRTCRLEREVWITESGTTVSSTSSTPCSVWVAENVVDHEHAWTRTGCWEDASGIYCFRAGEDTIGSWDDWLEYLQSLSPEELARILELAAGDEEAMAETRAAFHEWRASKPTQTDATPAPPRSPEAF